MCAFANLFLTLFLFDGVVSLLDELIILLFSTSLLTLLRQPLALLVTVLVIPLFIGLAINQRLPKRIFLPQIAFIIWSFASLWPLPAIIGSQPTALLAAAAQVLLGMLPLVMVRRRLRRRWELRRELFARPTFNRRYFIKFTATSLISVPFVLLLTGWLMACYLVYHQSGGFVRLATDGLYMVERDYVREGKTIRLSSMIHVGDRAFYDEMARAKGAGRTVILVEGVTDRDGRLVHAFNYMGLAGVLGLSSQESMAMDGRLLTAGEFDTPEFVAAGQNRPDIIIADLDISDFNVVTINFFNTLGIHLRDGESFIDGFKSFLLWSNENMTPAMNATITADIIDKRNAAVDAWLSKVLGYYDTVLIPWGALHMAGIEQAVIRRGFQPITSEERLSIDFSTLPYRAFFDALQQ
ncbi:MAG: hypothetical protein P1P74_00065 [Desulfuromonadales bacterium]|nr:hypothetical protein [Desulfuromonadales bacterium]